MSEWRDISTAPRDGQWILLTGGDIEYGWNGSEQPACVTAQFTERLNGSPTEGHWQFAWYDGGFYGEYENPTNWMPLPTPPEAE